MLFNSSSLYLSYSNDAVYEVIIVDKDTKMSHKASDFECDENGKKKADKKDKHSCSVDVTGPQSGKTVNITVVSVDEKGSMQGADSYPFESKRKSFFLFFSYLFIFFFFLKTKLSL